MAQLRDAKTSEILHEGTPLEVVLIADQIGRDEVLFDDVGEGFDPNAVLDAHRAILEHAEGDALKEEKKRGEITKAKINAAQKAMKEARAR